MFLRISTTFNILLIFIILAICFLLYNKLLQIGIDSSNFAESNLPQSREFQKPARQRLIATLPRNNNENEIIAQLPPPHEPSTLMLKNSAYELSIKLDLEKQEPGLGDDGKAAYLYGDAKKRGEEIYKKIYLNEELSERLSYNRTLSDYRHPACLRQKYDVDTLPSMSVVIIFFNEPYSVLVRTVHSTLNTCNAKILKEIILVDDGSTNMELGGKLDYYIKSRLPAGKVKILRLKNRSGLIRARLAGARLATGDILLFLDAHCEANIGWCEPLAQRIKESRTSVLVPIIDVIEAKNFEYTSNGYESFQVGSFDFNGEFNWIDVPKREKKRLSQECKKKSAICPTYSPTMAGGLFAIDRQYFWEVGSYDEQMDGWGGENLEMSFRIWQCGGTIETIPCSRVGHIFRDFHPYKFPNNRDTHGINTVRMALVWMDDYINVFFLYRPDMKHHPDIGNVTQRIMLRKKLHCKSFDWYLKNVYPEKFIPNKNVVAWGRVIGVNSQSCLDDLLQDNDQPYNLGIYSCGETLSKSQFFSYTDSNVLRNELTCATVEQGSSPPYLVVMMPCMEDDSENEKWYYKDEHFIYGDTEMCLDRYGLKNRDHMQVQPCDAKRETQRWVIEHD